MNEPCYTHSYRKLRESERERERERERECARKREQLSKTKRQDSFVRDMTHSLET